MSSLKVPLVVMCMIIGLSILSAAPALSAQAESDSESGAPYQNYITWNVCQSNCFRDDPQRRLDVQAKFAAMVTGSETSLRAAAAQELCQAGYTYVRQQVDGYYGFDSIFVQTKETSTCPNGVGSALFWRDACTTGCRVADHFPSAIQDPLDGEEQRGYACGRSNVRDAWYCSVHVTSKTSSSGGQDRYYQQRQIAELRVQSATWRENGRSTVIMGDFNVRPDQAGVGMGLFYELHVEADLCFTNASCRKTHDVQIGDPSAQDRKFDYIFASDTASSDTDCDRHGADPSVRRYATLTDHTFVRGYILCPNG